MAKYEKFEQRIHFGVLQWIKVLGELTGLHFSSHTLLQMVTTNMYIPLCDYTNHVCKHKDIEERA
jgi:hypothetical protein